MSRCKGRWVFGQASRKSARTATRVVLAACLVGGLFSKVGAEDRVLAELTREGAITARVTDVSALVQHPLVAGWQSELLGSPTLELILTSPDAQVGRDNLAAAEAVWGCSWQEAYYRLTSGGVYVTLTREAPPRLLVGLSADDEEIVDSTVRLVRSAVEAHAASAGEPVRIEQRDYRGHTATQVGDMFLVGLGRRLLISNHGETLQRAADFLLDHDPAQTSTPAEAPPGEVAQVRVDLTALRLLPDVSRILATPVDDPNLVFFLGGWLDLFRRFDSLSARLESVADGLRLAVEFHDPNGRPTLSGLEGYWADTQDESPAPLLMLPETVYSSSMYRNFPALWDARGELLSSRVVDRMDQGDADVGKQLEVLGLAYRPSDVLRTIGSRWRLVGVRVDEGPYPDVPITNLLPAWALVVELDQPEEFWRMVSPATRTLNLILSGEERFTIEQRPCGDSQVTVLSLERTPRGLRRRNRIEFNFRVTYGVVYGHLVVGTTPAIVEQVAEALVVEQSRTPSLSARNEDLVTERQFLDGVQLSQILDGFQDAAVRSWVFSSGVDLSEAQEEWGRITRMVSQLGRIEARARFEEERFIYEWMIEPALGR